MKDHLCELRMKNFIHRIWNDVLLEDTIDNFLRPIKMTLRSPYSEASAQRERYSGFQVTGRREGFLGIEIHEFGIFGSKKILASIFFG